MNIIFTPEQLTGKSCSHLVALPCLSQKHFLQADALKAFIALQQSALKNGFNLQPVSSFRDFQRQQFIWNSKFSGERKVHDDQGNKIDLSGFSEWDKIQCILRWSALPGGSRHHWGTEIDIFDPDRLPSNATLQLEPWEYEEGGYFSELSQWLQQNLVKFDFSLPFSDLQGNKKIGYEPWHISYLPVAQLARQQFSPEILQSSWQQETIAGKDSLILHLPEIFHHFFV